MAKEEQKEPTAAVGEQSEQEKPAAEEAATPEEAAAAEPVAKPKEVHPQNKAFQDVMELLYVQKDNLNDLIKECSYNIKWEVSISDLVAARMQKGKGK